MRQLFFTLLLLLLAIWTLGCVAGTVWFLPEARQGAKALAETWQALQSVRMGAAGANATSAEAVARVFMGGWFFIGALTWNLLATPMALMALIAKR